MDFVHDKAALYDLLQSTEGNLSKSNGNFSASKLQNCMNEIIKILRSDFKVNALKLDQVRTRDCITTNTPGVTIYSLLMVALRYTICIIIQARQSMT